MVCRSGWFSKRHSITSDGSWECGQMEGIDTVDDGMGTVIVVALVAS